MITGNQIGTKIKEVEIQPLKIPSTRDPQPEPPPKRAPKKVPKKEPVKV